MLEVGKGDYNIFLSVCLAIDSSGVYVSGDRSWSKLGEISSFNSLSPTSRSQLFFTWHHKWPFARSGFVRILDWKSSSTGPSIFIPFTSLTIWFANFRLFFLQLLYRCILIIFIPHFHNFFQNGGDTFIELSYLDQLIFSPALYRLTDLTL